MWRRVLGRAVDVLDDPNATVEQIRSVLDECADPEALDVLADVLSHTGSMSPTSSNTASVEEAVPPWMTIVAAADGPARVPGMAGLVADDQVDALEPRNRPVHRRLAAR